METKDALKKQKSNLKKNVDLKSTAGTLVDARMSPKTWRSMI